MGVHPTLVFLERYYFNTCGIYLGIPLEKLRIDDT